jgi:hypothetical protein
MNGVLTLLLCDMSTVSSKIIYFIFFFFFFFSFGALQLMLPESPQPYGFLYYPRIGPSNFLRQFRAATHPEQRKLEL